MIGKTILHYKSLKSSAKPACYRRRMKITRVEMSELVGKKILHYRILEQIGQGGMGVVCKAEDTKLERTVALKFLPNNTLVGDEEKKRFKREARRPAG